MSKKGKSIKEIFKKLPKERQEAIEKDYQSMRGEYLTLQDIRKVANLSQEQLSTAMEIAQGNLSKLENRSDMHVSTLQRYVEALGGKLHIMVALPNKPLIELSSLTKTIK